MEQNEISMEEDTTNTKEYIDAKEEAQRVFEDAIKNKILSANPQDDNFVGKYMYMGQFKGKAAFKHIITRQYLQY